MGFEEALIKAAYLRADIKTVEGVLNYIDANPNMDTNITNV
jgi:hypothetical protein